MPQSQALPKWLFTWSGTVTRAEYFTAGVILTGIKYLIDRQIAAAYGTNWDPWNYFLPSRESPLFKTHTPVMYVVLGAVALPFFWVGLALTLRRLRSAGGKLGWIFLFFVPVANLLFFLTLSVKGEKYLPSTVPSAIEDERPASALAGVLVSIGVALALVFLSVRGLRLYGGGLFLGLPFFVGFVSSAIYNYRKPRSIRDSVTVGVISILFLGLVIFSVAWEGVICLLMALPLALPLAIAGALLGARVPWDRRQRPAYPTMAAWVFLLPLAMVGEAALHRQPPVLHVTTSIDIDAPTHDVWNNVISFPPLAPPTELVFRSGIAYPTSGEIYGRGVGAVRHCRFSTGEFIEPITLWDEDRLLAFDVTAQPQSMRELSPWPITPPHLESNYMQSRHGQFRFIALPGGRTRLEGTTWYQNYFWPQPYWRLWSDFIVHRIHRRVLEHVKYHAEHPEP